MATIDGRPTQYGISLKNLKELMEHKGQDAIEKINEYGGIQEICNKLYTSPSDGNYISSIFKKLKKLFQINLNSLLYIIGLNGSQSDIEHRRETFGSNTIPPRPPKTFFQLVWEAMQDVTLIILQIAALVSFVLSLYQPQDEEACNLIIV